jgi:MFS family permease
MQSARGLGSLLAALMIASLGRFKYRGKLMTVGMFIFPLLLLAFAAVKSLPVSLLLLVGIGWSMITFFNLANSLVQTEVEDHLRGRVMGVYSLTFFGLIPVGSLLNGAVAERIGEPLTIAVVALISLAIAVLVTLLTPKLRMLE